MANYLEGEYLPIEELEAGRAYLIDSRNLAVGVWNPATNGFIGIREKFGDKYLFTEFHWDNGAPYGTVRPRQALDLWIGDIPLTERLGSFCQYCDTPTISIWENPEGVRHSDKGKCLGDHHTENPDCEYEGTYCAVSKQNQALFDLLRPVDDEVWAQKALD